MVINYWSILCIYILLKLLRIGIGPLTPTPRQVNNYLSDPFTTKNKFWIRGRPSYYLCKQCYSSFDFSNVVICAWSDSHWTTVNYAKKQICSGPLKFVLSFVYKQRAWRFSVKPISELDCEFVIKTDKTWNGES